MERGEGTNTHGIAEVAGSIPACSTNVTINLRSKSSLLVLWDFQARSVLSV
jgi:hypothetical protein